jgi:hypothetical protein
MARSVTPRPFDVSQVGMSRPLLVASLIAVALGRRPRPAALAPAPATLGACGVTSGRSGTHRDSVAVGRWRGAWVHAADVCLERLFDDRVSLRVFTDRGAESMLARVAPCGKRCKQVSLVRLQPLAPSIAEDEVHSIDIGGYLAEEKRGAGRSARDDPKLERIARKNRRHAAACDRVCDEAAPECPAARWHHP